MKLLLFWKRPTISVASVFMNADAGLDSKSFKKNCDEKAIEVNVKITEGAGKQITNKSIL